MIPKRLPLYAKILFWFFLNLAAVAAAIWFLVRQQFHFSALPARAAGEKVERVAEQIFAEILPVSTQRWDEILARYSTQHRVDFQLLTGDGRPVAGGRKPLPPEVHSQVFEDPREPRGGGRPPPPPPPRPRGERPPDRDRDNDPRPPSGDDFSRPGPRGPGPPGEGRHRPPPPPRDREFGPSDDFGNPPPREFERDQSLRARLGAPHFVVVQSSNPNRYWVVMRSAKSHVALGDDAILAVSSDSPTGHGFFFDLTPYFWWGAGILVLSILIWLPFVRGLTRSISRMRTATGQLAEGKFDLRIDVQRRDEVGELGASINRMAERLAGYVKGQKRFLGDVAHELCAPTARLQMAISILEQRIKDGENRERLADVREEIEHMGALVNELLQFSRASAGDRKIQLQPTNVLNVVERAVRREAADITQVHLETINPDLHVLAEPELLLRAVSNLLRNAIRYAGHAGPISISASRADDKIVIAVRDRGPGIAPDAIPRIFEPFYRADPARSAETGGAGLGLAIVKTCIEACGGTAAARNLPVGLEVTLTLPFAPAPAPVTPALA